MAILISIPEPAYCVVNKITFVLPYLKLFKIFIIWFVLPLRQACVILLIVKISVILENAASTRLNTINFPFLLFRINSINVSSLLRIPLPIQSLLDFLDTSSIFSGTIAVKLSILVISLRQLGHLLILSADALLLFNKYRFFYL